MVAFNALKVGDVLWDCRRQKMGNTRMSQTACWQVRVVEINPEKQEALVSWNGNPPKWRGVRSLGKLRRTVKK